MKKFILSLAIVATTIGAFAAQTPATTKKAEVKVEKPAKHKAKKEKAAKVEVKKETKEATKTPKSKK